jgi:pentatricopeptide repeat domain-containing protein 1
VHTYSALMNVCIKANELGLALDVFNQLLREGCTPNLVTFNTLIDVYGKTGQWEEAVKVLDALQSQVGWGGGSRQAGRPCPIRDCIENPCLQP